MCGRFSLEEYPKTILENFDLPTYPRLSEENFVPRNNIAPSANIITIFNSDNAYELGEMHWGIVPPWAKPGQFKRPLINARSETIWEKPSFKNLIKSNRCVILANSFYEWNRDESPKQPYRVTMKHKQDMAMAGIYQVSRQGELQCCVVTMRANGQMATIHHRMPVLLSGSHLTSWMASDDVDELNQTISEAADTELVTSKISPLANKASNQGQQCFDLI